MSAIPNHDEITTGTMATKDQNIASKTVPPALEVISTENKATPHVGTAAVLADSYMPSKKMQQWNGNKC